MEETTTTKVVEEVVGRLLTRFPDVPRETIADDVRAGLHSFDSATVRDFLPVLVERRVAVRLRAEARPAPGLARSA